MTFISDQTPLSQPSSSPEPSKDGDLLDAYSRTVVQVARHVSEAVVQIKVKKDKSEQRKRRPGRGYGAGSGFIISSDGYVVTNSHVINGAINIEVNLQDGRRFTARLVGNDPATDLAIIKIDTKKPLPTIKIGSSSFGW